MSLPVSYRGKCWDHTLKLWPQSQHFQLHIVPGLQDIVGQGVSELLSSLVWIRSCVRFNSAAQMKQWLRKYFTNYKELQASGGQSSPRMLLYCIQGHFWQRQRTGMLEATERPFDTRISLLWLGSSYRTRVEGFFHDSEVLKSTRSPGCQATFV